MKRWLCRRTSLNQTAGLRLRYFLGRALQIALLGVTMRSALHAQIAVESPIRVAHVEGYVVNSSGKPVANVEVTLSRDETVLLSTHTDLSGIFRFDHASGDYWFRVARSKYAPAARQIVVREEVVTLLQRKKLYVILGPGACMDECSSVFTSKREFDQVLRKTNRY
jgi:hypothetical protein